jgi:fructuronate reductase
LILAVAGWMRYVGGTDEQGSPIDVKDPLAARLRALSDAASSPREKVVALLNVTEVFTPELAELIKDDLCRAYEMLNRVGARECVRMRSQET